MDGRMTRQEFHAANSFKPSERCHCGRRPERQSFLYGEYDEVMKRGMVDPMIAQSPGLLAALIVKLKGPDGQPRDYVRISRIVFCKDCTVTAERVMAKHPSWCVVDRDYGPAESAIISAPSIIH